MVSLTNDWDNPRYRDGEQRELEMILKDVSSGEPTPLEEINFKYETLADLDPNKMTTNQLIESYRLLNDYCVMRIISTMGRERMKYVRRSMMIVDAIEELKTAESIF